MRLVIEGRDSKCIIKQIRKLSVGLLSYLQMRSVMDLPIVLDQGFI